MLPTCLSSVCLLTDERGRRLSRLLSLCRWICLPQLPWWHSGGVQSTPDSARARPARGGLCFRTESGARNHGQQSVLGACRAASWWPSRHSSLGRVKLVRCLVPNTTVSAAFLVCRRPGGAVAAAFLPRGEWAGAEGRVPPPRDLPPRLSSRAVRGAAHGPGFERIL